MDVGGLVHPACQCGIEGETSVAIGQFRLKFRSSAIEVLASPVPTTPLLLLPIVRQVV